MLTSSHRLVFWLEEQAAAMLVPMLPIFLDWELKVVVRGGWSVRHTPHRSRRVGNLLLRGVLNARTKLEGNFTIGGHIALHGHAVLDQCIQKQKVRLAVLRDCGSHSKSAIFPFVA